MTRFLRFLEIVYKTYKKEVPLKSKCVKYKSQYTMETNMTDITSIQSSVCSIQIVKKVLMNIQWINFISLNVYNAKKDL